MDACEMWCGYGTELNRTRTMTIVLYDYCELEERTSKHFKIWKALHITIYALVALLGIVNYSFLEGTLQFYDGNCILYPRQLEFYDVDIPCINETHSSRSANTTHTNGTARNTGEVGPEKNDTAAIIDESNQGKNRTARNTGEVGPERNDTAQIIGESNQEKNENAQNPGEVDPERDGTTPSSKSTGVNESTASIESTLRNNVPDKEQKQQAVLENCVGNETSWSRPALDVGRTLFGEVNDCDWALYTPMASTIFAAVWVTMFTMCPGGGRVRAGHASNSQSLHAFALQWISLKCVAAGAYQLSTFVVETDAVYKLRTHMRTSRTKVVVLSCSRSSALACDNYRVTALKRRLQQPWRILAPALVFSVVLAIVTGHSFSRTSGGLHAFCAGFVNMTNTTTCSPVTSYTEAAWNASLGVGGRAAVVRAASAGVWAGWACAAALLLARCVAAPDFVVRRTGVLLKDPQQVLPKECDNFLRIFNVVSLSFVRRNRDLMESANGVGTVTEFDLTETKLLRITSRLKKSPKKHHVQFAVRSGSLRDNTSVRSEPTLTSELVTASVEHHEDSTPSSIFNTPVRRTHERESMLEMTSLPHIDDKTTPDQYQ
ncbi:hypothetical protein EVAR_87678_1 [Eumeta japonica]|uniref:Uncharacterized protein n=1 Tax=Eumeta variegata TaxID=151549 RepID=A0A4C1XIE2_EUMVA|nr:hypothetical protein EVAR_87678_1 [Eumeta japonica]